MTVEELIDKLQKYCVDDEIVLAQHTLDSYGRVISVHYFEPSVAPWNRDDEKASIVLYPGELVSG